MYPVTSKISAEGLLILTSLADGPKHGYAILQDIARTTGRELGFGSLYGAIARLETAGYIVALAHNGPRRPYRLTPSGAQALRADLASLRTVVAVAERRLGSR